VDQQTLPMQQQAMQEYAAARGWEIVHEACDNAPGVKMRPKREAIIKMAKQRKIDAVIVWKLDRWGRSLSDLVSTLEELAAVNVVFVSVTEAIDLTTPIGRAMVGFLSVFAQFERDMLTERIRAGMAHAKSKGKVFGRAPMPEADALRIKELSADLSPQKVADLVGVSRTTVLRVLGRAK
jgi:putative DNA-invertase from lambdoid prophage Rac